MLLQSLIWFARSFFELAKKVIAEKKRKKEEAIAISKAAVALREKEATDLKLIEDAKSSEIKSKAEQAEQEDDDNWETKSF